jgi:hypothetical protein
MPSFLEVNSFLDIDLHIGTKAIAYSGLLGSWIVGVLGRSPWNLEVYQDYLDTVKLCAGLESRA